MPEGFSFAEALQPAQPKGFSFAEALAPPAPDPLADSEGHLIDNPDEALKRGGALVQSAWGRLSGTDRPPADTGDAVDTVDTRDTIAPGLRSALAPAANTTYGQILPFARDQGTGDVRLALPSSLRDLATGGLDLLEGPTTGTVTPAATSLLANAAIGGGLTPSLVRGTGAAIRDTAELGAPAADLYRPRITATEVQARDGVGIMEAWNRAHAENNAAAIAKIGQATDIDGAIAAFGKAAEAPSASTLGDLTAPSADTAAPTIPSGWTVDDRFGPTPGPDVPAEASPYVPITSSQVQRRDGVGAIEAGRRADAENAANAPVPQSAGAAASRDTTLGTSFGRSAREITGAQADKELADLMRTPQPGDSRDIIPGATQTRAEIELSPSTSREAKGLRQEFREGFNEHEKANNELYHNWVDDVTPTSEQIGTMKDVREAQWKADEATVFGPNPNGEPVTTAPIVQHLQEVLADPVEKHNSYLQKAFQPLLDKLTDDDGAPIQLGAKELYGIRQEMGRKVKDMATDTDLAHLRGQFGDLMKVTDDAIMAGAPDYRAMMDRYRDASIPINAGERLQEGALKITNGSDRTITFGKFDAFMKGLWMERNGPNPYAKAKAIDQATWDHLMQLHERLARSASDQELARTRGSDTTQMAMEMMRKGAIGTAHAIVGKLTGGLGNIAIPIITKQIDESRALRRVGQHLNPDLSRYPTPGP